jgi:hypothetical protein
MPYELAVVIQRFGRFGYNHSLGMCECFHRARTRKISLKNGASTPTFSPFDWQVSRASKLCEAFTSDLSAINSEYFIGGMMRFILFVSGCTAFLEIVSGQS